MPPPSAPPSVSVEGPGAVRGGSGAEAVPVAVCVGRADPDTVTDGRGEGEEEGAAEALINKPVPVGTAEGVEIPVS